MFFSWSWAADSGSKMFKRSLLQGWSLPLPHTQSHQEAAFKEYCLHSLTFTFQEAISSGFLLLYPCWGMSEKTNVEDETCWLKVSVYVMTTFAETPLYVPEEAEPCAGVEPSSCLQQRREVRECTHGGVSVPGRSVGGNQSQWCRLAFEALSKCNLHFLSIRCVAVLFPSC